jgi:hypothetical protein
MMNNLPDGCTSDQVESAQWYFGDCEDFELEADPFEKYEDVPADVLESDPWFKHITPV